LTRQIFTSQAGRFIWIVAPIILMMLIKAEPKRRRTAAALDD
jgi:hypothetical protein